MKHYVIVDYVNYPVGVFADPDEAKRYLADLMLARCEDRHISVTEKRLALITVTNPPPATPAPESEADIAHVMQFFAFGHLPERLQSVSKPFAALAALYEGRGALDAGGSLREVIEHVRTLPDNRERDKALAQLEIVRASKSRPAALDALLIAKDAAVRSAIAKP